MAMRKREPIQLGDLERIAKRIRRQGTKGGLRELDRSEPILATFIATTALVLAENLRRRFGLSKDTLSLVRREIVLAQLVCVEATRRGAGVRRA